MTQNLFYKYRKFTDNGLRILVDKQLYFASPGSLNDPLDYQIPLSDLFIEMITEATTPEDKSALEELKNVLLKAGDDEDLITFLELLEKYENQQRELGVLSLSANGVDPLLWSHYADGHQGFCIGFSKPVLIQSFRDQSIYGGDLVYSDLPWFKQFLLKKAKNLHVGLKEGGWKRNKVDRWARLDFIPWLEKIILTLKYQPWEYENEYRFINTKAGPVIFPAKALKQIIFGVKMKDYKKEIIKKILNEEQWQPVELLQVKPSTKKLAFDIAPSD